MASIERLGLDHGIIRSLKNDGVNTIGDLRKRDLKFIPGIGKRRTEAIVRAMHVRRVGGGRKL